MPRPARLTLFDSTKFYMKSFFSFVGVVWCVFTAFLYFVTHEWALTKTWLTDNHVISFSQEGVAITLFDNVIWYFRAILALSAIAYCFFSYKFLKSVFTGFDYSYLPRILFFAWLSAMLMIVHRLTTPVPGYGFTLGLFSLVVLGWVLHRVSSSPTFKAIQNF